MYNTVLEALDRSKELDETLKDIAKEVQGLNKEKEVAEKQRIEAMKKQTELELDVKDLQEKIYRNIKSKVHSWSFQMYELHLL